MGSSKILIFHFFQSFIRWSLFRAFRILFFYIFWNCPLQDLIQRVLLRWKLLLLWKVWEYWFSAVYRWRSRLIHTGTMIRKLIIVTSHWVQFKVGKLWPSIPVNFPASRAPWLTGLFLFFFFAQSPRFARPYFLFLLMLQDGSSGHLFFCFCFFLVWLTLVYSHCQDRPQLIQLVLPDVPKFLN